MFTYAQAITRLGAGPQNLWRTPRDTMTSDQQLQRLNEVLERIYEEETWRGVRDVVTLTSSSGIITLPASYLRIQDRIHITTEGRRGEYLDVKGMEYRFQPNGPGSCYCGVAIDMGDNTSGVRRYRVADPDNAEAIAEMDALTYEAYARKRYVWVTDTSTVVVPDCFSAIKYGVRAMAREDQEKISDAEGWWQKCFAALDSNLGEYVEGNDPGSPQWDQFSSAQIVNLV